MLYIKVSSNPRKKGSHIPLSPNSVKVSGSIPGLHGSLLFLFPSQKGAKWLTLMKKFCYTLLSRFNVQVGGGRWWSMVRGSVPAILLFS